MGDTLNDLVRTRVLVVDDHLMVRAGLRKLLGEAEDLEFAGEAGDGAGALAQFTLLRPDVVLMDLVMPGMDGAEATARICASSPGARVVAMTSFDEDGLVGQALDAGAVCCLIKDACPQAIYDTVREAAGREGPLDVAAVRATARIRQDELGRDLSPRERQVLRCLATGMTNEAIAAELDLSLGTVRVHVGRILKKLHAPNRTAAVVVALEHGLVSSPRPGAAHGREA